LASNIIDLGVIFSLLTVLLLGEERGRGGGMNLGMRGIGCTWHCVATSAGLGLLGWGIMKVDGWRVVCRFGFQRGVGVEEGLMEGWVYELGWGIDVLKVLLLYGLSRF